MQLLNSPLLHRITFQVACLCLIFVTSFAGTIPYDDFPVDESIEVNIEFSTNALKEFTEREKKEQIRDWLLYTILSNLDLDAGQLCELTFDLPAIRYDYLLQLHDAEHGPTRVRYVENGLSLCLIPQSLEENKHDHIASILDDQRKDLGMKPDSIWIFEYKILSDSLVILKNKGFYSTKPYFSEEHFYYETDISNLTELEVFLSKIDYLTYFKSNRRNITIGGRKHTGRTYKGISIEEIATIYQAYYGQLAPFFEFAKKWQHISYTYNLATNQHYYYTDTKDSINVRFERELKALLKTQIQDGLGFSLDPEFIYEGLINIVDTPTYMLGSFMDSASVDLILDHLHKKDALPLLRTLEQIKTDYENEINKGPFANLTYGQYRQLHNVLDSVHKYSYILARYDGALQGTSVGMNLFYTDFLLKLWQFNYAEKAPIDSFPDFPIKSNLQLGKVHKKLCDSISNSRLWLGPDLTGFQVDTIQKTFLFGKVSTKIFAASFAPGNPGIEVDASPCTQVAIDWLNHYYEQIAAYEPAYEQLNETMKWSMAIYGMYLYQEEDKLAFLNDVKIQNTYRFPEWAMANESLRFDSWEEIPFNEEGYRQHKTETFPMLQSTPYTMFGNPHYRSLGGVSLMRGSYMRQATRLSNQVTTFMRRAGLNRVNPKSLKSPPISQSIPSNASKAIPKPTPKPTFTNSKGSTYQLTKSSPQSARITSTTRQSTRLTDKSTQSVSNSVERSISKQQGKTTVETIRSKTPVGKLEISKTPRGFSQSFKGREFDEAYRLAKHVSDHAHPERYLAQNAKEVIKLKDGLEYLVKPQNSSQYLHIKIAPKNPGSLVGEWQTVISGHVANSRNIFMQFLEESTVLSNYKNQFFTIGRSGSKAFTSNVDKAKLIPVEINQGKEVIKAFYNPRTRQVLYDHATFGRSSLDKVSKILSFEDRLKIHKLYQPATQLIKIRPFNNTNVIQVFRQIQKGDQQAISQFNRMLQQENIVYAKRIKEISQSTYLSPQNKQVLERLFSIVTRERLKVIKATFDRMPLTARHFALKRGLRKFAREPGSLIVQDNPAFKNLDFSLPIQKVIQNVITRHPNARLAQIPTSSLTQHGYKLASNTFVSTTTLTILISTSGIISTGAFMLSSSFPDLDEDDPLQEDFSTTSYSNEKPTTPQEQYQDESKYVYYLYLPEDSVKQK